MKNPKNPLEGITLETILNELVKDFGWPELAERIRINCFDNNPSIKSSLYFLRRTPWARAKVEDLYLWHLDQKAEKAATPLATNPTEPKKS